MPAWGRLSRSPCRRPAQPGHQPLYKPAHGDHRPAKHCPRSSPDETHDTRPLRKPPVPITLLVTTPGSTASQVRLLHLVTPPALRGSLGGKVLVLDGLALLIDHLPTPLA